jgi:hypothetical protein
LRRHGKWQKRLKEDDISFFQMNQFANSRGQFKDGWKDNEPRRRNLLCDLMEIILEHTFRKFGCVIENRKFREIITDAQLSKWRLDAYSFAGFYCALQVDHWRRFEKFDDFPLFVFEDGDPGKGLLAARLRDAGFGTAEFKPKLDKITKTGPIRGYTPLQAADFLAYEIFHANKELENSEYKPRWAMLEFHNNKVGGLVKYDYHELNMLNEDFAFNERLKEAVKRLEKLKERERSDQRSTKPATRG